MKKIALTTLMVCCLPWTLAAQNVDDDLYFVPSKSKKTAATEQTAVPTSQAIVIESDHPTTVVAMQGGTRVVVQNRTNNGRDVDEYNRRYDATDNDFSISGDTLYITERESDKLDGEWVNGFNGSDDDYEYATRIIRFRNPRYAISISSPFYWDVVYGLNSWDWNVYTDGFYAYAFPTFSNRLWWDWRYNAYGWGSYPYYGWGWHYGWYGGPYWAHHHHHGWCGPHWGGPHWGGGHWHTPHYAWNRTYTSRRSYGNFGSGNTPLRRSNGSIAGRPQNRRQPSGSTQSTARRSTANGTRRVVGTRGNGTRQETTGMHRGTAGGSRGNAASSRHSVYTRPSSTRSSGTVQGVRSGVRTERSTGNNASRPTYSRGSSGSNGSRSTATPARRQESNSFSTGNRSSYSSGGGSTRSTGSYSGGGSSRSGGSSSRSSGGSSRGGRR